MFERNDVFNVWRLHKRPLNAFALLVNKMHIKHSQIVYFRGEFLNPMCCIRSQTTFEFSVLRKQMLPSNPDNKYIAL